MEVWGLEFDKKICTDGQDLSDFEDLCQGAKKPPGGPKIYCSSKNMGKLFI